MRLHGPPTRGTTARPPKRLLTEVMGIWRREVSRVGASNRVLPKAPETILFLVQLGSVLVPRRRCRPAYSGHSARLVGFSSRQIGVGLALCIPTYPAVSPSLHLTSSLGHPHPLRTHTAASMSSFSGYLSRFCEVVSSSSLHFSPLLLLA
ncbi:uncharacterized protein LY79DRAFT_395427 [Colletotrichum navitas]|uniref:Uncharacterized protein n=1 Tax=Colletotrichum navitas TaxID=681940 RepID=A0AAD8V140_9PEZI|nr:uncharacterized protein LY79DRAFT_395427 [Colletotrichum navitas]KAK1573929.1 hypothetical protein LY79DRAFT_395427 [Colletotrichum navitas]